MTEDRLTRFLDQLEHARPSGAGYSAVCPAHEDRVSSLSVSAGDNGGIVVFCHAGCSTEDVLKALGKTLGDLAGTPFIETRYVYQHVDGSEAWTVERWANPKDFRVNPGLPPAADRVLYNLPWVDYARRTGQLVYVVEGEKDVETLREFGLVGTTNVGGAGRGKWLPHYSEALLDLDVLIIADNDEPGLKHARSVFRSLDGKAKSVSVARPLYGKDVSDLLHAGYPIDHVEPIPEEAPLSSVLASAVRPQPIRWAWERYIPMGSMTIIEGDPGDGKSTLTCDLIARWSTGAPMPDGSPHDGPWHTMMISAEDDPATTIVPRLLSAGARLDNIVLVTGGQTEVLPYNLGVDLEATERQVRQYDTKVIVLDPLMAFLPEKNNGLVDSEVRKALAPLQSMARRLGIAVVVVRHLTKSATRALYAGSGSIGIIGAARAAFLVRPSKADPELRILAPTKTNLVRKPTALGYRLEDDPLRDTPRVRWDGPVEDTADTLFEVETTQAHSPRDVSVAADWLKDVLDNTFMTWAEVMVKARANGFAARTLVRARAEVAAVQKNPAIGGELADGYYWYLASQWPFGDDPKRSVSSSSGLPDFLPRGVGKAGKAGKQETESHTHTELSDELSKDRVDTPTVDQGNDQGNETHTHQNGNNDGEVSPPVTSFRALPALPTAGPGVNFSEARSQLTDSNDAEPVDPDDELMSRKQVCDVCGSYDVIPFYSPWWVIRCRAHNPITWGR